MGNSPSISLSRRLNDTTSSAAMGLDKVRNMKDLSNGISEATEGYFEDGNGQKVGGLIRFRIVHVETSKSADRETSFVGIEGSLLDREGEFNIEDEGMR